jgi:hypothetical protein
MQKIEGSEAWLAGGIYAGNGKAGTLSYLDAIVEN